MGQDRRDNPWERIASRLDEAYDDARALAGPQTSSGTTPARSGPSAADRLIELLSEARRDVRAREVEASDAATRAQRLEAELDQQRRRADTLVRIGKAINAVREVGA